MACPTPPSFGLPPVRPRAFSRVPPAVFPAVFGGLGLALAWRAGVDLFALPTALSDLLGGAMTLLFAISFFAYARKISLRPSVILEDLSILPGRTGLAAAVLGVDLGGLLLAPLWPLSALALLWAGLALHAALIGLMIRQFLTGPREQARVTPAWHLTFSGPIIASLLAATLGKMALATALFWPALACALVIWAVSLDQFRRASVPAPLRPLLAIHLAPLALFGTVALLLGYGLLAQIFVALAALYLALLIASARWLTRSGFSAFWGAFTFPVSACAGLILRAGSAWHQPLIEQAGALLLIVATLITLPILGKILQLWIKGQLAAKSNAATA